MYCKKLTDIDFVKNGTKLIMRFSFLSMRDYLKPSTNHAVPSTSLLFDDGAPWARAADFVKKPPLIINVTYLELNGFNASIWVA